MENKTIIEQALKNIRSRARSYENYTAYYKGLHPLNFATDKFRNAFGRLFQEFADNLCPAVVDALCDKLIVTNFAVEEGNETASSAAWAIWKKNRMDKRAGEVHLEAVKTGDAYAIVWANEKGEPVIYPNKASLCTVQYDEEKPGVVLWGAKCWQQTDKKYRLTLYFKDRIEKYITRTTKIVMPEKANDFVEYEAPNESFPLENPYGVVPIFHFGNNAGVGEFGASELVNAIPIQNALNKSVCDMMVGSEFVALPQRWATGLEIDFDENGKPKVPFTPGVERIWTSDSAETKFGQFDSASLDQFLKMQNEFRAEMARVTGTPLHYFLLQTGSIPSGEALKTLEKRFSAKVTDRQNSFGNIWENIASLCLQIENSSSEAMLSTIWQDAAQSSEKEMWEILLLKQQTGIPDEQIWAEAGYGEEDIKRFKKFIAEKRAAAEQDFNAE